MSNRTLKPQAKVLLDAADHIERYGHCKHRLGRKGEPTCAVGAIVAVAALPNSRVALEALEDEIGGNAAHWNNKPERTAAEVTAAMRTAALRV